MRLIVLPRVKLNWQPMPGGIPWNLLGVGVLIENIDWPPYRQGVRRGLYKKADEFQIGFGAVLRRDAAQRMALFVRFLVFADELTMSSLWGLVH